MELLSSANPTILSYWLTWRVALCATWVFGSMIVGFYLIWKYEYLDDSTNGGMKIKDSSWSSSSDAAWRPCIKGVHPIYLFFFRLIAFCLLFVAISFDVAEHGFELYYYYTQWTFTIVTLYFGIGSVISIHGCFRHQKMKNSSNFPMSKDAEQGFYTPLASQVNGNREKLLEWQNQQMKSHLLTPHFWSHMFQVFFQLTAGSVAITDLVYWCVMFPFLTIKDYQMNFLTVVAHSLNAILLLGDTALNSLQFPVFRISYFLLLTSIYVIFQWAVHASVLIWWPYPFLELSADLSPLWYLVVALLHIPSYGLFVLVAKLKHSLLSRWFPHSYCYSPAIVS